MLLETHWGSNMRPVHLLAPFFWLALCTGSLSAVELAKIDRTIVREPTYASTPKYCLLVFGPEAKTRIWLVIDDQRGQIHRRGL